jgi:hypothetical protein
MKPLLQAGRLLIQGEAGVAATQRWVLAQKAATTPCNKWPPY